MKKLRTVRESKQEMQNKAHFKQISRKQQKKKKLKLKQKQEEKVSPSCILNLPIPNIKRESKRKPQQKLIRKCL